MARASGAKRGGRTTAAGASRSKSAKRPGSSRTTASGRATSSHSRSQNKTAKAAENRRGGQPARSSRRASESQQRQARPVQGRRSTARTTFDHDEIRRWAEERGAQPACVRRTGSSGDIGMIRLDFPGYSGAQSLEPISWDDWFQKFDESNLALIYQESTAGGQKSNFNKLVGRETAEKRARGDSKASRRHPERSRAGSSARNSSSGRTTGRRSAKRGPQKAAKAARRPEPISRTRKSSATATRQGGGRTQRRKAA